MKGMFTSRSAFYHCFLMCFFMELILSSVTVKKSEFDTRLYSSYVINNGISVISIQHPQSAKSGYAAAVGAGSLLDPIETQGLAHLLEHMLFLGTKSHPGTSSYDDFLSQHGGSLNAWTADERTVYHNQVDNDAFVDAIGRFSEFFTEPLLNGTSQRKEILAVDAEHQNNVPADSRRMWAVFQFLFPFPLSHFNTGNLDTLENVPQDLGIDIFDYLRRFHTKYYCGSNMAVVTLSPLSLKEQRAAVETHFGRVDATNNGQCEKWSNNEQLPDLMFADKHPILKFFQPILSLPIPYAENGNLADNDGSTIDDQKQESNATANTATQNRPANWDILKSSGPIIADMKSNGQHAVWLCWSLPSTDQLYNEKPLYYLRYMVGYGGQGSLEKHLKHRHWINSLDIDEATTSRSSVFIVSFSPTELGKVHLWDIVEKIVGYINDVRDSGVNDEVLSSLVKQSNVLFSVTEPEKNVGNDVAEIADALLFVKDPSDVLTCRATVEAPNATRIQEYLDFLQPERLIIIAADPNYEPPQNISNYNNNYTILNDGHTIFRTDPFYKIDHTVRSMPTGDVRKLIDAVAVNIPDEEPPSLLQITTDDRKQNNTELHDPLSDSVEIKFAPPISRIPRSLAAFNASSHGGAPEILRLTPFMEVWWRGSGVYPSPRARIRMLLRHRASEVNLQSGLAADLFCTVVNDQISSKLADYTVAGYSVKIFATGTGFNIQIDGFNDEETLKELTTLISYAIRESLQGTKPNRYQQLRQELISELSDVSASRPTKLSMQTIKAVLLNNAFLREDILDQLSNGKMFQNYDLIATTVRTRLRDVHTTSFTMGLSKRNTLQLIGTFVKESGFKPLYRRHAADSLTVHLTSPLELSLYNPVPDDTSNAALVLLRTDFPTTIEDAVETQILANMLGTKVMEQLRTEKQLGYTAGASMASLSSLLRIVAFVEGPRKPASDEMMALEEVIEEVKKNLTALPDPELQKWRMAIKGDLSVTLINSDEVGKGKSHAFTLDINSQFSSYYCYVFQEHQRLWPEIEQGVYCFQRQELHSKYLNDESIWKNKASAILSKAFNRLIRSSKTVKILMHASESPMTQFIRFPIENDYHPRFDRVQPRELKLSAENITKFQEHFGFLPISNICGLNRRRFAVNDK